MKKAIYIYSIVLLAACAREMSTDLTPSGTRQMVFHATFDDPSTKTVRMGSGDIYWSPGDKIRIFHAEQAATFQTNITSNAAEADFIGSFDADEGDGPFYAFYDNSEDAVLTTETVTSSLGGGEGIRKYVYFNVPSAQSAPEGSFAPGSFPSYAVASGSHLSFKNICGGAVISISRPGIRSIIIKGNRNEKICGTSKHYFENVDFLVLEPIYMGGTPTYSITLTPSDGGYFKPGERYYVSMLPAVLSEGLTLTFITDLQEGVFTTDKEITISTSKFGRLFNLDEVAIWGEEKSNCYVVKPGQTISFETAFPSAVTSNAPASAGVIEESSTKAIPPTLILDLHTAEVIWESFGTAVTPSVRSVVASVSYSGGIITVVAGSKQGNAVVALKNGEGEIEWSWHIWVTDADLEGLAQEYKNGAGVAMDRNLGALSATPGDVGAIGLMYQWGRKDPFPGPASIDANTLASTTLQWPKPVESSTNFGKIDYAVSHPTVFIYGNNNNRDWFYSRDENTDQTRWNPVKGAYDPCPAGWQVPELALWKEALGGNYYDLNESDFVQDCNGVDLGRVLGVDNMCWYPSAGYLYSYGSTISCASPGSNFEYWGCERNANYASRFWGGSLYLSSSKRISLSVEYRAHALPVRCVKSKTWKTGNTENIVTEYWDF